MNKKDRKDPHSYRWIVGLELFNKLEKQAHKEDLSINQMVSKAIKNYLLSKTAKTK